MRHLCPDRSVATGSRLTEFRQQAHQVLTEQGADWRHLQFLLRVRIWRIEL
jgi:hypothetical protein